MSDHTADVAAVLAKVLVAQMIAEYGEDDITWRELGSARRIAAALLASEPIAQALAAVEAVARVEALHGGTHWCFADAADDVYERGTEWWPCPTVAALRPEGGDQ